MIAALLLAASPPAHDPKCNSIGTNDLIECAASDLRGADAELNRQWRRALQKAKRAEALFNAESRAANDGLNYSQSLLASQRAWLAYRDAQCRFSTYKNVGGREYRIYRIGCISRLTKQRVKELTDFNEGQ